MRIDYEYGAPDMRESVPQTVTPDRSSSSSARVEDDQGESMLPLHHQVKSTQAGKQTSVPSTPTKSGSSRVEAYQSENTPSTVTWLDYDSSDSSVSPSPRYIDPRYIDQRDADEVRLSINFQNVQYSLPSNTKQGKSKTEVILQIFGPKLVLEVMGGAGAVWGFSEAIGLRTSATAWFWRPVTLFAGALFFIRWYRQLQEFRRQLDLRAQRRSTVEDETTALVLQENV